MLSLLNLKLNVLSHYHLQLPDFVNFAESVQVNLQLILEISELGSNSVTPSPYFVCFFLFSLLEGRRGFIIFHDFATFHQSRLLECVHAHVSL